MQVSRVGVSPRNSLMKRQEADATRFTDASYCEDTHASRVRHNESGLKRAI